MRLRITLDADRPQLRGYKHRWKIEWLFAWLQNFRRTRARDEQHVTNYEGMVRIGCIIILLRQMEKYF